MALIRWGKCGARPMVGLRLLLHPAGPSAPGEDCGSENRPGLLMGILRTSSHTGAPWPCLELSRDTVPLLQGTGPVPPVPLSLSWIWGQWQAGVHEPPLPLVFCGPPSATVCRPWVCRLCASPPGRYRVLASLGGGCGLLPTCDHWPDFHAVSSFASSELSAWNREVRGLSGPGSSPVWGF